MASSITTASCITRRIEQYTDLLPLHGSAPERYPFLLESVAHGSPQARYDILFAFPGASLSLLHNGTLVGDGMSPQHHSFLGSLDEWFATQALSADPAPGDLPFRGGWFVYLGYELAGEIEPVLRLPHACTDFERKLPHAVAVRCPAAMIRDHEQRCTYLLAEPQYEGLLDELAQDLATLQPGAEPRQAPVALARLTEEPAQRYLDQVVTIRRYIVEGDVFQVNLSRKWLGELAMDTPAEAIYRRLRRHNPAPFAGIARFGQVSIISSSPERLVKVTDDVIQTRPIAGTRPRAAGTVQDRHLSDELLGHPKEQAEHIMLIDLERNDLGRVCDNGTVTVDELMVLESYAHVHHIVSNVQGRLKSGTTPGAIVRAVFPGGTITGCPKVRCMEIIAELEQQSRGAYTGSMGYLNRDGDMDLNILIRTLVHCQDRVSLRAGAGIVYDSDPAHELDETRAKAKGMLLALQAPR